MRLRVLLAGLLLAAPLAAQDPDPAKVEIKVETENVLKKYDALGQGFVKTPDFIELIYNELKGQAASTKQASRLHH